MYEFCKYRNGRIFPEYIPYSLKFSNQNYEIKDGFVKIEDNEGLGINIDTKLLMEDTFSYRETELT